MSELYHVIVQRRGIAAQIQLNFIAKGIALDAFETLSGHLSRRVAIEDSYGTTIAFDPDDIGHVMLLDAGGALDMQATFAVMQARAQAEAEAQAKRDPVITRGGLVLATAGQMPQ